MRTLGLAALLASLLLLASLATPAAAEGERAPEVVTSTSPVSLAGTTEASLTDVITLLRAPSAADTMTLTATAPTVKITRYWYGQNCLAGDQFCQFQGSPTYNRVDYEAEDVTFTLDGAYGDFLGIITTDRSYQRGSLGDLPSSGEGRHTGQTLLTGTSSGSAYDADNFRGLHTSWESFPDYHFSPGDFAATSAKGGNVTFNGWFEITLFDAAFRMEGDGNFPRLNNERVTTSKASGPDGSPNGGGSGDPEVVYDDYYVLEFFGEASLALETDGPVEHVAPTLLLNQKDGFVQYTPQGAAAVMRRGDHSVVPQRYTTNDRSAPLLQFVLTPLTAASAAPPAAPPGSLAALAEDPAVQSTAAVAAGVAGVAGLVALAYWWPAVRYGATALALPMYTRIGKGEVLEHDTRDFIYNLIKGSPGIHAHEISEKANIGWGTTVYHLKLLESHRMVVGKRTGRYKRFFVNDGRLSSKKEAYGILRNETSNRVAQYVLQHPGCNQKDLCEVLGLKPSLVNWHMTKLEEADLVKKIKDGRTVRYFAGPAWAEMQLPGFGGAVATPATPAGPGASAVSKSLTAGAGLTSPVNAVGEDEG